MLVRGALSSPAQLRHYRPHRNTQQLKTIENVTFACVGLNKCLNTTLRHLVYSLFKQGNKNWVILCILHIFVLPASVTTVRGGFSCYSCYWLMKGLKLQCPLSPQPVTQTFWLLLSNFHFQTTSFLFLSQQHSLCLTRSASLNTQCPPNNIFFLVLTSPTRTAVSHSVNFNFSLSLCVCHDYLYAAKLNY